MIVAVAAMMAAAGATCDAAESGDVDFDAMLAAMGETANTYKNRQGAENILVGNAGNDREDNMGSGAADAYSEYAGLVMDIRGVSSGKGGGKSAGKGTAAGRKGNAAQGDDLLLASVSDAMCVENALDYILNAYSSPLPVYSGGIHSQGIAGRGKYAYLIPPSAMLPISGKVTSGFGYRPRFKRMHKGVDISLNMGDTVCAAINGTVLRVSNDPRGYGLFVCIQHDNGLETRYAHLSKILAVAGERIYAGEPVGLGGSTGNSTGPHLHFETRVNGEAVDPTTMFDFSMPGGRNPYRTLADLDKENPRIGGQTGGYDNFTAGSTTMTTSTGTAATAGTGKSTYVVRQGDTIASVARKNGVSVLTLCRLNALSSDDALQPGRMLKLR